MQKISLLAKFENSREPMLESAFADEKLQAVVNEIIEQSNLNDIFVKAVTDSGKGYRAYGDTEQTYGDLFANQVKGIVRKQIETIVYDQVVAEKPHNVNAMVTSLLVTGQLPDLKSILDNNMTLFWPIKMDLQYSGACANAYNDNKQALDEAITQAAVAACAEHLGIGAGN